jgi:hypothetical protein
MEHNFDYNDGDFIVFLSELLDSYKYEQGNEYDKMFVGIATFAIEKGWNALSKRQQEVINKRIIQICPSRCNHCLNPIPWSEMLYAMENDGMCSHCVKICNDLDKE